MSLVPHALARPCRPRVVLPAALVLLALLGALLAAPVGTAQAAPHDPVPDGQALPGYTILNPPLAPIDVGGAPTTVYQGTESHAGYVLEAPADWNGELALWAHGYRGTGTQLTVDPPPYGLRQRMLGQGYAWAASSYASNGYDVASGVTTTHDLARLSARLLGERPRRTYLAGVSMGGHVIGRSLEEYPNFYDGALPMCGVLGDQELFDYFLDYNLAAQDLADRQVYPAPSDYLTDDVPRIEQRLGLVGVGVPSAQNPTASPVAPPANPLGVELRSITTERSGGPRPGAEAGFGIFQDFLYTLYTPDDGGRLAFNAGRLAQNAGTVYTPTSPVDVNATITRVSPTDPASRGARRLIDVPTITGKPKVPVLTLHGLGDLFVPFSMEQIYARDVARNKQSDLLVQRAIRSVEHCDFTPTEVGTAWDDLTTWVESQRGPGGRGNGKGKQVARPAGDDVLTRSVVASPTYGCRFSDPDRSNGASTRFLIAPCPR